MGKGQGYAYEHAFAKDWNAMRGYHYLMRIAHLLNTLARYSTALAGAFTAMGIQAFLRFVRTMPIRLPPKAEDRDPRHSRQLSGCAHAPSYSPA